MDASTATWLSEMGMEDPSLLYQCQMDFLHDPIPQFTPNQSPQTFNTSLQSFYSTPSMSSSEEMDSYTSQTVIEKPQKLQKINHLTSKISQKLAPKSSPSTFSNIISFGNHSNSEQEFHNKFCGNIINSAVKSKEEPVSPTKMNFAYDYGSVESVADARRANVVRSPLQAKDHVIAERKRREKLNESFIALSALLPNLTKLDKASILGVAIEHIKELHGNVKVLEQGMMTRNHETAHVIKPSTSGDDDTSSSVDNYDNKLNVEVEVRICGNDVLIRVHCKKENGIMGKIFGEIERLNMIVINSNAMPFGHTFLDISIVAQMEGQFSTSAEDLANNLRSKLGN